MNLGVTEGRGAKTGCANTRVHRQAMAHEVEQGWRVLRALRFRFGPFQIYPPNFENKRKTHVKSCVATAI